MVKARPDADPRFSQSERLKKSFGLSSRERRAWAAKVMAAIEAREKAEEVEDRLMHDAWQAGMSYASLGALWGLHGTTVKDRVLAHKRRAEEDS